MKTINDYATGTIVHGLSTGQLYTIVESNGHKYYQYLAGRYDEDYSSLYYPEVIDDNDEYIAIN